MMRIDKAEIIEGLTVYPDEDSDITFFVLPSQPTFRLENGKPIFKFMKYRFPIDRPDGKKGGGFAIFDVEFVVPEDKMKAITSVLQERVNKIYTAKGLTAPPVRIGQFIFTKGKSSLNLENVSGAMVEKVWNPGMPSLYGKYITPFTVEFTPEGATLFESALKGKGGAIQVAYDLYTIAKLPPVKVEGNWNQHKFYQFYQTIDVDWRWWGADDYKENITETFRNHESYNLTIDPGGVTDPKVISQIRESAQRSFDDAIARSLLKDVTPVSEENKKLPEGIEHLKRNMIQDKSAFVSVRYTEGMAIEWNPAPRGTLPNITTLPGVTPEDLKEYFVWVDLDDKFFRSINVTIMVNADFEVLPIHSVEAHLEYNQGNTHVIEEPIFTKSADIGKFRTYTENDVYKYKYWYQVNYKGGSPPFKSKEVETDEKSLVINVDDTGIFLAHVMAGDIDFNYVKTAQVAVKYKDFEEQFVLDKDKKEHRVVRVLSEPVADRYQYNVKYTMSNGTIWQGDVIQAESNRIFINNPFAGKRTISVRSLGDMEKDINTIYVDMRYEDTKQGSEPYVLTQTIALSKATPFFDWDFPVVSSGQGKVTYSGTILYKDGTSEPIKDKTGATTIELIGNVIYAGPIADYLEVSVVADLLDFAKVKLVKVSLSYKDEANNISEKKDVIIKEGATPEKWLVKLKDKTKNTYDWKAVFFMVDTSKKETELNQSSDATIVLEVPA